MSLQRGPAARDGGEQQLPEPYNMLLPQKVRLHPFSGATFGDATTPGGLDVRVEAIDAYGDPTKAFGVFRFEVFQLQDLTPDGKGNRIAVWEEDVQDPQKNFQHWDRISRAYQFRLCWGDKAPEGGKYILQVSYCSPYTQRLFAQRTFVPGE